MPSRIRVVGMAGDRPVAAADGDLLVGGRRHLAAVAAPGQRTAVIDADVDGVLSAVAAEPGRVCVLASGDPGFFGIVRHLATRFGREALDVHPAPSAVALAFARLGMPWDDACVVSAHGRPLSEAVEAAVRRPKVAVLVAPDAPPEALGRALLARGAAHTSAAVCARLGLDGEDVSVTDLPGLAAGSWDPLSVVVLWSGSGIAAGRSLAFGADVDGFAHRAGMVTKSEVRAVVLAKLELPAAGVLWDVGAGSGSVAVECARLAPWLGVHAVERDESDVERIRDNARSHGVAVEVTHGEAPAALAALPAPDRVFVGGGGLAVLDACMQRLRPGGRLVATFAAMDRAAAAAARLGALVQVSVSRGAALPDGGLRLAADNPVFVVWGPR